MTGEPDPATGYDLGLPIDTARLTLRALRAGDGDDVHAIYRDPEVSRYLYSEPLDLDAARRYAVERSDPVVVPGGDGVNLAGELRETGQVVATFYIRCTSDTHRQGEIGYVVSPAYAGRGLATEGARALLSVGFDRWRLHRVIGRCDARNAPSAAVLRRLGMRQEAVFRENEWVKGEWTDERVFAILADEWHSRPDGPAGAATRVRRPATTP